MPQTETATKYTIKPVPKSQLMDVVDLWAFAFDLRPSDPILGKEKVRARIHDYCENTLSYVVGAFDNERLAAVSGIIDFYMHLGDCWVKCAGIAGVATYPEYRRQSLVKALLTNCLKKAHGDRVAIASLWPFSYPFYERMGWAVTDMRHEVEVTLSALRQIPGNAMGYRSHGLETLGPAMKVHERWCEQLNLSMRRTESRWRHMLQDARFRYRLFVHEDGYMLWNIEESSATSLYVSEWCYLSDQAFIDGLSLISQMDSKYQKARMLLPEVDTVLRLAGLSCGPEMRLKPGMMSRVVNLEVFLASLPGKHKPDIDVSDPLGVTAPASDQPVLDFGPGALVQHVTSFWKTPNAHLPASLYGVAAHFPPFSVERY